jgi:hypothetical protein
MSSDFDRAFAMWDAARPASGFRPETPEEWQRVLRANEEMGYAMFRDCGMPEEEARDLARQIHGGPAGFLFLQMAFAERDDDWR